MKDNRLAECNKKEGYNPTLVHTSTLWYTMIHSCLVHWYTNLILEV